MEVDSVLGLSNFVTSGALVDRCASFLKMRGTGIEFVHQSARDYLAGENGKSILDTSELYGHYEIVVSCLSYLSQKLKVNLVDLPRPDSTWSSMEQNELLRSLDYSATFWAQHLEGARWEIPMQNAPIEQRVIHTFLCSKFLEWLECLSLLDKLERAADALKILQNIADLEDNVSLSMLVQGAKYFLFQDYETIEVLPLQIYNSVLVFSPNTSIIRKKKLDKLPVWLRKLAQVEDSWVSSKQTLIGKSKLVKHIAFSPDGKQIASVPSDGTIKLWDAMTGNLQRTIIGHSNWITTIAFSPDSKKIASGSYDKTIKLWNAITGDLQRTLIGHSGWITTIAFSPDGKKIASGSSDQSIKLWDIAEALKVSRIFGNRVGRHIDFRKWQEIETLKVSRIFGNRVVHHIDFRKLQEIETSEEVKLLGFSTDGRHLITDLGLIKIENTINTQSPDYQSLQPLSIGRGWILYGEMPIVHLPFYFGVCCYDTMGDQMAICLINGKVLIFDINRASLDSILKGSV
ncbi:hypothetical protein BofuT4_P135110.1 [Botrytis cinerea T4]|uniref:Uncharacterized protein n=1 Tax=Botryotinia fuckeliana (strain T4) TaxID=999810 RepID=G2YPB8_BOTF4|nr:hypothetical protein BofuT4_P135110.1 [Botrytis cinerea T4]